MEIDKNDTEDDTGPEEALKEELEAETKKNQELMNRLKYMQADFENYRKRVDAEAGAAGEAMVRSLVAKLLIVADELELAAKHAQGDRHGGELKEGLRMVEKNLGAALESVGVERIDCVGKPFDPSLHEATEKAQGKSVAEDMVVKELRPGYVFRGRVLRPSMVKVELGVRAPAEEAKANE